MTKAVDLVHRHGEHLSVIASESGVELLRYVYRAEDAWEAPKPYIHPLRTLSGQVVTGYRPNDHRWHKGLQMTASHLSGANLWGGNSYVHGKGYRALPERVGSMAHMRLRRSVGARRRGTFRGAADLAPAQWRALGRGDAPYRGPRRRRGDRELGADLVVRGHQPARRTPAVRQSHDARPPGRGVHRSVLAGAPRLPGRADHRPHAARGQT